MVVAAAAAAAAAALVAALARSPNVSAASRPMAATIAANSPPLSASRAAGVSYLWLIRSFRQWGLIEGLIKLNVCARV